MLRIVARLHQGLAWLLLAGLLLQVYFAGTGLFGAQSMTTHVSWGYMLAPMALPLLLLGLLLGWRIAVLSALFAVLIFVQGILPHMRVDSPWIAALHPVNALALIGVTLHMALRPSGLVRQAGARLRDNAG